jgi:hypothetical protein
MHHNIKEIVIARNEAISLGQVAALQAELQVGDCFVPRNDA